MNRQYEANDTLAGIWGHHKIRFGADAIVAHNGGNSKEFGGPSYLGVFAYNTCTLALAVCESSTYLDNIANVKTYSQSYGNAAYTVTDTLFSAFVQDDFQVRRDLTINLGVRYELQTFTDSRKSFAPRAGFAYNVGGDGKTVIRGGFGIYYSQVVDNSEANYALTGPTGVFTYAASPGQVGFPASVSAVPGEHADRLPKPTAQSVLGTMEHGNRAPTARRLGVGRGLRRVAHSADQSPARRRPAHAVRPHFTRTDSHSAGR